jgi:hypothetical protein
LTSEDTVRSPGDILTARQFAHPYQGDPTSFILVVSLSPDADVAL